MGLRNERFYRLTVVLVALLGVSACASSRNISVTNLSKVNLDNAPLYFIAINTVSKRINYDYVHLALTGPVLLNYDYYTKEQAFGDAKPDVPAEIIKYLKERGKRLEVGTLDQAPASGAIVFTYEELWGWDVGDIIKRLEISARYGEGAFDVASVSFSEMTMFNSHPIASSLVPEMMNRLFTSGHSTSTTP